MSYQQTGELTRIAYDMATPQWVPVSEHLPTAGVPVIAFVAPNEYGKTRCIRAQYAPPLTLEMGYEQEGGVYDEATDCYYCDEGCMKLTNMRKSTGMWAG